jgi:hypothetical protein
MAADYGLYVRDVSGRLQAAIEDFHDLEVTLRHNAVGGWRLTLPTQSPACKALNFGGGIVVIRNGVTLLSGDVRGMDRNWTANGDTTIADGPDDLTLLADELAFPDPTQSAPNGSNQYATQVADVQGLAAAETVIKSYVNRNIGPGAVATRQRYGLVMAANLGRGNNVTGRARFQPLLDLVQELATTGNVGISLKQTNIGTGFTRQFDVYVSVDQTGTAIFSADLGTLSSFRQTLRASEANYFVAGGGNEGVNRIFREGGDVAAQALYGRIVQFIDRRDTTVVAELDQAIAEAITSKAQKAELQLTPLETGAVAYGTDYNLGDQVAVIMDGITTTDLVRTVVITLSTDKAETVTPYVGSASMADKYVAKLFRALKSQDARLRNLERR